MSNAADPEERPLRLLALDGGGIRGYSELKILEEIMHRIAWEQNIPPEERKNIKPCDYFDMIGGTSTGGIIAILLARLEMTVQECLALYSDLSHQVFAKDSSITGRKFESFLHSRFSAETLKDVIKNELRKRIPNPPETEELSVVFDKAEAPLYDPSYYQKCKAFVLATPSDRPQLRNPHLFRTYAHRENDETERQEGGSSDDRNNTTVKIWEALRATSAASTFFDPISIGEEIFVDGGLGCNNPARKVYEEAQQHWKGRRIGCLISLGTGMPKVQKFEDPQTQTWWQSFKANLNPIKEQSAEVLLRIATECESTHREMLRVKELKKKYFRFNVQQGLQGISLEEYDRLGEVATHTTVYLGDYEINRRLDDAVKKLTSNDPADWLFDF